MIPDRTRRTATTRGDRAEGVKWKALSGVSLACDFSHWPFFLWHSSTGSCIVHTFGLGVKNNHLLNLQQVQLPLLSSYLPHRSLMIQWENTQRLRTVFDTQVLNTWQLLLPSQQLLILLLLFIQYWCTEWINSKPQDPSPPSIALSRLWNN